MTTDETLWVYRRGAVVLGLVLDRDGYVVSIVVAGARCDWARTAMWEPRRSIRLGDDFQKLINRYGYPEQTSTYDRVDRQWASTLSLPAVNAAFGGISNAYRDLILHYGYNDNIEFTLRDMKVVRIFIWDPDARPPATRGIPGGGGAAAGGAPGGPGGGAGGGPGGGAGGAPGGGAGGAPGGGGAGIGAGAGQAGAGPGGGAAGAQGGAGVGGISAGGGGGRVNVRGYSRRKPGGGTTYVRPHTRSRPRR